MRLPLSTLRIGRIWQELGISRNQICSKTDAAHLKFSTNPNLQMHTTCYDISLQYYYFITTIERRRCHECLCTFHRYNDTFCTLDQKVKCYKCCRNIEYVTQICIYKHNVCSICRVCSMKYQKLTSFITCIFCTPILYHYHAKDARAYSRV